MESGVLLRRRIASPPATVLPTVPLPRFAVEDEREPRRSKFRILPCRKAAGEGDRAKRGGDSPPLVKDFAGR